MKRTPFLALVLCLISFFAAAQSGVEICGDGIDNDGDGFIDCFDGSCANVGDCDGSFLGNDATCQATPLELPKFTMTLDFASPNETTNHLARMAIGDLDRDGIPEIVSMNRYTKKVFVLNGNNGTVKHTLDAPFTPQWEVAIGNIDNDNCGEIFLFGNEGNRIYLYGYSCDLQTQLWRTQVTSDPINFGLADFNGDGKVELYAKDEIYDAKTGVRLVKSNNWKDMNGGPVAVDMMGDENLELVVGGYIYSVNLGPGSLDGGSLTELKKINDYYIRFEYNATSVADFNLDGFLDVIISGSTIGKGKNTTVYFWDVQNDQVKTFFDNTPGSYQPNGWENGTGRINISDLDGDGKMNVSYVSGKFLYALKEDFTLFWRKVINEETSGHTGCTLFDFNNDRKAEIVYRDEQFLYIINGTDGSVHTQQNCVSRTNREYPIVADVDADGSTEICVPCGFDDDDAWDNFDDLNYSQFSHIRVFKSGSEPWVPARRVWNQHGYFNVNVNDDLTIPKRQQKHHLVFSEGECKLPNGQLDPHPARPLNSFLNQAPYLDSFGCPTYIAPNLGYVDNSLIVNPPTCPEKKFTVSFKITNKGDAVLSGDVPMTFYNGNPLAAGAIKLTTITRTLTGFGPGAIFSVDNVEINGPGSLFTLFIVLNDGGTTIPTPISLPNTNFVECDYTDNVISAPVLPKPLPITAEKINDNAHCDPSTTPDNGAVKAWVQMGAVQNTADFNFRWFNGTTVDPSPDFIGAVYTGVAEGTYSVFAVHKTAACNTDTAQVVVGLNTGPVVVTIDVLAPVSDCKNPNGSLKATVSGGQPASAYTFAWYEGNGTFTTPQVGVSDVATGLKAMTYTVLVTEKISGCFTIQTKAVPSTIVLPVVDIDVSHIICSSANSGELSATADGKTSGYKFSWYIGPSVKPSPDFNGPNQNNLAGGQYTLVATNNSSKCSSPPETRTIDQSPLPVVTIGDVVHMTSCDPTKPNGSATAAVTGGSAGYTFEWFKGTNLTAPNKIGSAAAITGLAPGVYTVRATHTTTGCKDTEKVKIENTPASPTLTVTPKNVTTCNPFNGGATAVPSIGSPSDYTYKWYNGTTVAGTLRAETGDVLSNLPPGDYTVQATHKTMFCNAPPKTVKVLDLSPSITITLNSTVTVLPSDCNSNDGVMEVDITGGSGSGFSVTWHFGRAPFAAGPVHADNNVNPTSTATGLITGVYTVTATDLVSGCSKVAEFDLPFANAHSLDIVAIDHVTTCVPGNDGAVTVKLNKTPLPGFDEADYTIVVYEGTNDKNDGSEIATINGISGTLNYSTAPGNQLEAGTYTFVAINNNNAQGMGGCRSVPKTAIIERNTDDPVVEPGALNANSNCAGATGNGAIMLSVNSGDDPNNYTFEWHQGSTVGGAPIAGAGVNGEQIANLAEGFYTAKVTGLTGIQVGCFTIETFSVGTDPMDIDLAGGGFTVNDLMNCDAVTGLVINNGSATITDIDEDGGNADLADYTFEWTNEAGGVIQTGGSPTLVGLAAGDYFVHATQTVSKCALTVPFTIEDSTIGSVGVELIAFVNPERCILDKVGRLEVVGTGTSSLGYGFAWYNGDTPIGAPATTDPNIENITVPGNDPDVTKTVVVTNLQNFCRVQDEYIVPLVINEVLTTVSSSPLTSCVTLDGSVFGTVTNDNSVEYAYNWYDGNATKPLADHNGKTVPGLGIGEYTMVAVDLSDNFCVSLPKTVEITDGRVIPVVTANAMSPVSNCDPEKANGSATAFVGEDADDIFGFEFEWFVGGLPIADAGASFFDGPAVSNVGEGVYSVRATDRISRCFGDAAVAIIQMLEPIPNPDIVVVSHVTSCVTDNGILSASVNGNTEDYIFNWYEGSQVTDVINFHGELVDSLAVGFYTVTATSRITGCTTGPDTDEIRSNPVYPDFDFKIIPASCEGDNGFASLVMSSNVPIDSIVWHSGLVVLAEGPNMENIGAGTYDVTVVSDKGCETTKTVTIGTEIRPYNGISRNGDGRNEIFNIACIENFPGNSVKIFNRAGTLVYEGEGYNNVDIYFDGKSNRGVSPMGILLPDGTYFYVIDKRDGSKPLAGYIEIVK